MCVRPERVSVYVYARARACVCVKERERKRARESERERENHDSRHNIGSCRQYHMNHLMHTHSAACRHAHELAHHSH